VAAFFAEPVMGAGGVIVPPRSYYQKVQAVLKKYDVLFMADEVICGFGRTGNMWGSETFGIKPDILTCAKQLSSAYLPISAVLISEPIYQAMASNADRHGVLGMGYTYGGHPVAAAVAVETLRIYEERDMIGHVRRVMGRFQERLHGLADHPLVGEARGVGLVGAVEIVADKQTREQFAPSEKAAARVSDRAFDHGLIVRGLPGDSVACCPPLIITEEQIDDLFDRFRKGLDDAAGELAQKAA
jgi:4-aminobutyrate--pyruvate transaminase